MLRNKGYVMKSDTIVTDKQTLLDNLDKLHTTNSYSYTIITARIMK